jgi:uncharacterized membrane protein
VDENLLVGELVRFITAAARATQQEELRLVDGLDLTLAQFTVMHLLDSTGGELSTSELAHQLGLPAGTTSRAVDTLVRRESWTAGRAMVIGG